MNLTYPRYGHHNHYLFGSCLGVIVNEKNLNLEKMTSSCNSLISASSVQR